MKCPKCGCENPEEANFCCECGTKIESKKFLCPKCHASVKEGAKHCTNCGNSLNWVNVDYDTIPIPVQSALATPKIKVSKEKPVGNSINKTQPHFGWLRFVVGGIILLGILLMFIGNFGAVVAAKGSGVADFYSDNVSVFSYYFSDIYNEIESYLKHSASFVFTRILLLFIDLLVHYTMFVLIFVGGIMGIVSAIRHMVKHEPLKLRVLPVTLCFIVLHLMIVELKCFAKEKTSFGNLGIGFGWGSSLLLAGTIIILVALIIKRIFSSIEDKEGVFGIVSSSLSAFAQIGILICSLLAFGLIYVYAEKGSIASEKVLFTPYYLFSACGDDELGMIGFYLLVISGILVAISFVINLKKQSIGKAVFFGVSSFFVIVGQILLLVVAQEYTEITFSMNWVLFLLLTLLVLGSSIVANIFKKKVE